MPIKVLLLLIEDTASYVFTTREKMDKWIAQDAEESECDPADPYRYEHIELELDPE